MRSTLGYVIFHRHGQRAPAKNLFQTTAEVDLWKSLLASSDKLESLSERFPVNVHKKNRMQRDLETHPFGCITQKGIEYMEDIGRQVRKKFAPLSKIGSLNVYATNYQRTQVSAQCFLSGLQASEGVPVNVRESAECAMSFYEGKADLAKRLTRQVQQQEEFQLAESEVMEELGYTILRTIPELGTTRSGDSVQVLSWMAALDYFSCRLAHSLPVHPSILHLHEPMMRYIGSRYRKYYSDPEHLEHSVRPMLRDTYDALHRFQKPKPSDGLVDVVLFSGHDVNLLGLHHAINSSLVHSPNNASFWPHYGSVLMFELVYRESSSDGGNVFVNVYYDMEPLSFNYNGKSTTALPLTEFERLFLQ